MTVAFRRGWGWALLTTLIVSTIGDEITLITLTFRTAGDDAAFAVPLLLIVQLLPGLIATPHIGRLTDRADAGLLLVCASVGQGLVVALLAFDDRLGSTLAGAAALGLFFAISGTATFALIPVLAQRLGLTLARANAALEIIRSAGMLVGPVAGGLLVAWGGTRSALLIDGASFLVLAGVLVASGLRRAPLRRHDAESNGATLWAEYRPLLGEPRIVVMIGALTLEVFATAIADVAFVYLVTVSLAAGPTALGMLTACWAAGMLIGAWAGGAMADRRPAPLAFATATIMGAAMLAIGVLPGSGVVAVSVAFFVGGAANSIHNVAVRTMLQREAPAEAHGRVAAIYVAATRSATIAGFLAGGLFVPGAAYTAYAVGGAIGVFAGLAGWWLFSKIRASA